MTNSAHFSLITPVFYGMNIPEEGSIVGYGAIINKLDLHVPIPDEVTMVSKRNRKYQKDGWSVFPHSYLPEDHNQLTEIEALYNHLVFALKYEGINLLVFSFLIKHYSIQQLEELVSLQPTGLYSRRIWFLIEWISNQQLPGKADLPKKGFVPLLDSSLQYSAPGVKSPRHRIINNLPGTRDFCPLIRKTEKLENYLAAGYSAQTTEYVQAIRKDLLQRASSFLLFKDSKASFTIEGESPKSKRAARWGRAIGQAGTNELSKAEITRLQQIVIENARFINIGYRTKGGFVGEHDRATGKPVPDHISARWQDLDQLMNGLLDTNQQLVHSDFHAVLAAAIVAFGFVFIHPLEDGNGRIHRYLVHHVLAKKRFAPQSFIFPVSASMLDFIGDYQRVLRKYSLPLLDFIEWKETSDHNVEVLNETIDYYRYFDATAQAEFLFDCVKDTIDRIIPEEVAYLSNYDAFKRYLDDEYEMPDRMVDLLVRFLEQNDGKLSKRAKEREFVQLSGAEIRDIESRFFEIFRGAD